MSPAAIAMLARNPSRAAGAGFGVRLITMLSD